MSTTATIARIGTTLEYQEYSSQDLNLIQQTQILTDFGAGEDYIECYITDLNGEPLYSSSNITTYKLSSTGTDPSVSTSTAVEVFPDQDVQSFGIDRGSVFITYYFYKNLLNSNQGFQYWIKEISSDRTELKVTTQGLSNNQILEAFNNYSLKVNTQAYYPDFLLNFGENSTIIGVNLATTIDLDDSTVLLVKLYEPLPDTLEEKSTFWFVEKLTEPISYTVTFPTQEDTAPANTPKLRGPNFGIAINQQIGQTVGSYSYNDLFSTSLSSSYQQVKSLLEEKGVEINVDYSDFSNFIHFSSVEDRIYNFTHKLELIESYSAAIQQLSNVAGNTVVVDASAEILKSKINSVTEKFDGYEYYLYYESGALSWPKRTLQKPYTLYSVTSSQAKAWLGSPTTLPSPTGLSILYSASYYDSTNKDLFIQTVPAYLREDDKNLPYETFLNMVGQHFDNIWIYLKDVTKRFDANSSLTKGISKDLVANALKGLGINLYTNTNISDSLYYSILGFSQNGSLLPPTGSEVINTYITSSEPTVSAEDITLEYYKRIYHNLPYLLKTKGTERGLRALINCFGIPGTLLNISEYGGVTKDSEYGGFRQDRFSLAYRNDYTSSIVFPWAPSYYQSLNTGNSTLVPDAIEFRFKSIGIPTTGHYSQSLFQVGAGSNLQFGVNLTYNPSVDLPNTPYESYGYLTLHMKGGSGVISSAPIHLPFFDSEQWWTVLLKRDSGSLSAVSSANNRYWVYVKSAFYNEEGISKVGFEGSSSIYINGGTQASYNTAWSSYNGNQALSFTAYLGGTISNNVLSPNNSSFNGYFQEFRYWIDDVKETALDKHVLNSRDYSLNHPTASQFNLIFRAPLGNNLTVPYLSANGTQLNSKDYDLYLLGLSTIDPNSVVDTVHPAITGSYYLPNYGAVVVNIPSFINGGSTYGYGVFSTNNKRSFVEQTFTDLVTSAVTGNSQRINNKVIVENSLTSSIVAKATLNPNITLQNHSTNRTISSPQLEVAYSPADLIDEDILNQLGGFNIDDYIGNPSHLYTKSYPDLTALKEQYFSKYLRRFNLYDFIRLLKYIDNSLFKMIKDFTPARANLSTGVVVKSHILERPKYPRHEPSFSRHEYNASINTAFIEGATPESINYQTAYSQSVMTPSGSTTKFITNYQAQYTGEFDGTTIDIVTGNFPQFDVSNVIPINTQSLSVNRPSWTYITYSLDPLLNNVTQSRKSKRFYDADYNYDAVLPVNFNAITYSISQSQANIPQYDNTTTPWARLQDSNYQLKSFTNLRYSGSKTQSKLYSTYSAGDSSYGKTAAIDKIRFQYAYLKDIYTASLTLPSRSNAQIKYLIDDEEFVLDLTKENNNIFDVQNIYKGGEQVNISLFDYTNQSTNKLTNKSIPVYEGGFRYLPIMYNLSGAPITPGFTWKIDPPLTVLTPTYINGTNPCDCTTAPGIGRPDVWTSVSNWTLETTFTDTTAIISKVLYTGDPTALPCCRVRVWVGVLNEDLFLLCKNIDPNFIQPGYDRYQLYTSFTIDSTALIVDPATGYFLASRETGNLQFDCECPPEELKACRPAAFAGALQIVVSNTPLPPPSNGTGTLVYVPMPTTRIDDPLTCLEVPVPGADYAGLDNRLIRFSSKLTEVLANASVNSILFDDTILTPYNYTSYPIEQVTTPFSLEPGDAIHFYFPPPQGLGWMEQEEYRVVTTFFSGSNAAGGDGERFYALLDRTVNPKVLTAQPNGAIPGTACKYIIAKHIPDETNVILRYNPIDPELVEEGILYPQYILEAVRKSAGNVIKSLKSQGLI